MQKHRIVWLPLESPALEANLDELERQGWRLVSFFGYPDMTERQQRAVVREVEAEAL